MIKVVYQVTPEHIMIQLSYSHGIEQCCRKGGDIMRPQAGLRRECDDVEKGEGIVGRRSSQDRYGTHRADQQVVASRRKTHFWFLELCTFFSQFLVGLRPVRWAVALWVLLENEPLKSVRCLQNSPVPFKFEPAPSRPPLLCYEQLTIFSITQTVEETRDIERTTCWTISRCRARPLLGPCDLAAAADADAVSYSYIKYLPLRRLYSR